MPSSHTLDVVVNSGVNTEPMLQANPVRVQVLQTHQHHHSTRSMSGLPASHNFLNPPPSPQTQWVDNPPTLSTHAHMEDSFLESTYTQKYQAHFHSAFMAPPKQGLVQHLAHVTLWQLERSDEASNALDLCSAAGKDRDQMGGNATKGKHARERYDGVE